MAPITYDAPPLVEVAMSIQFDPPKSLNQAHLGAFWDQHKDFLPIVRATRPIATINESFGTKNQWTPPSLQFALTNEPDCRLQMTSSDDEWMCQLQSNRLAINWRKRSQEYPRFHATWEKFLSMWTAWIGFLNNFKMELPHARIWEVTYVNRIPQVPLWKKPSDWPKVFPGLWGGAFHAVAGAELQGLQGQWVWEFSDPSSRLYIEPRPGRSPEAPDQNDLLLSLTARGPVDSTHPRTEVHSGSTMKSIESGIGRGHELIVSAFDQITSIDAQRAWGRHADVQ